MAYGLVLRRRTRNTQELDREVKRRIRRNNAAGALSAIAKLRRDDELTLAADFHADKTKIPSLDDLAGAHRKREWLIAVLL